MKLIIRQPDERELEWIRFQWVSDLTRAKTWVYAPPSVKIGKMSISNAACLEALKLLVPAMLERASVLVGVPETHPDEALAWIAWHGDELLYVRVNGDARRKGIATALFETTDLALHCPVAFMSKLGAKWRSSLTKDLVEEVDHGSAA